ncbi:methyl-galactoside ABC transporter ATPase [Gammaproteobacteria bacterium]|nr:methyl-galactoside ABC transporter ATPase [Gammaproteobacteria bacterium]
MLISHKDTPVPLHLLEMQNIVKRFGGNAAVSDVSIDVIPGQILALLGENGAGKSTLIKILAGVYTADEGKIFFRGQLIKSAAAIKTKTHQPIAFIHQDLGLVEWMTVAENMAFVMGFPRICGLINWAKVRQNAVAALRNIEIDLDPDARVFELSRTEKSLLAIARAIAVNAEVLVLDEPTASLPADDVRHLFTVLNRLRDKKVGMIYVTHRLDEVIEIADQICVMRDGRYVAGGITTQYCVRDLVQLIVGEAVRENQREDLPELLPEVLSIQSVIVGETGPVSFTLQPGEMLALVGLRGAGHEEIGRLLFGLRQKEQGNIILNNKSYTAKNPKEAMQAGISLVAGDRIQESLIISMTVSENLFINPCSSKKHPLSYYSKSTEYDSSKQKIQQFDIRPNDPTSIISTLSGGNQQKVVITRWLGLKAPVLILEDPTAGVDVGARADIYDLLNLSLAEGVAILVISTDFEEIAHICNRALVFNRGQVVGELKNEQLTFANLLELASACTN